MAAVNPTAMYTKTCPGNPPRVSQEPFKSVWLLHVLSQKNTHTGSAVQFAGTQTLDPGRFQDSLPQVARDFLLGNPTLGPTSGRGRGATPGAAPTTSPFANLPGVDAATAAEIDRAMREARSALQQADLQSGQTVYTFNWDLKPMTGAPPAP